MHLKTQSSYVSPNPLLEHDPPLLYQLGVDPGEKYDVAEEHPEVIQDIMELKEKHQATVKPVEDRLVIRMNNEE